MTDTRRTTRPADLSAAVAPVRQRYRELIDAAIAWQSGRERETDPDHFALICAATEPDPEVTTTRWTRTGTYGVVRCGIPNWCSRHRCLWPEEILHATWDWFDFLHATGRMDPDSDPLAELRKPLICSGGLDQHGRPLPDGAPRQVECECFLPYRETTALLSELVQQAERSGEDPLDALRRALGRPTRSFDRWEWDDPDDPEYGHSWTAPGP